MAICERCGRKYRMNWVRMQPCPSCRGGKGRANHPATPIPGETVPKRFAVLQPPEEGTGFPSWDASDDINGTELTYGVEFSDESREWAIVVQLTYNQGGRVYWLVSYVECDGGSIQTISGGATYRAYEQPEIKMINEAIGALTAKWTNPLNKEEP